MVRNRGMPAASSHPSLARSRFGACRAGTGDKGCCGKETLYCLLLQSPILVCVIGLCSNFCVKSCVLRDVLISTCDGSFCSLWIEEFFGPAPITRTIFTWRTFKR